MIKDLTEDVTKDISGPGEINSSGVGGSTKLGSPDKILLVVERPDQRRFP